MHFETIKPGRVPFPDGRLMAPHITVWIVARGINIGLHTRMYFGDEEKANAEDPILARIEHRVRVPTLIAPRAGRHLRLRHPSAGREGNDLLRQLTAMTVSPFDHPLLSALLGDEEAARHFSVECEIAAMLAFERALGGSGGREGIIAQACGRGDRAALALVSADMAARGRRGAATASSSRNWCGRSRAAVGEPHGAYVHFGATSQDVIDTALVLRLKPIVEHLDRRLTELDRALRGLERALRAQRR